MADTEQLEILNQGIYVWRRWRSQNPNVEIMLDRNEFSGAILAEADLSNAYLAESNFSGADLRKADLRQANLGSTKLNGANLSGAQLTGAYLEGADLIGANLIAANLVGANLTRADLSRANLTGTALFESNLNGASFVGADFSKADLRNVNLTQTDLRNASFNKVVIGGATLANIDLSVAVGLESVIHNSASTVGTNTLIRSKGKIPEPFLRGCGLSDWEIESAKLYDPNMSNQDMDEILYKVHDIRAHQPIQISPLFISYSHTDGTFVAKLEKSLNAKGVRFWRDIHDTTAGRLEKQIDRAIRHNPTLLLVLSKYSIESDWVQHEVRLARKLEKETGQDVLCPVALDDSWKTGSWPERIMEQVTEYNILDFSAWNDDSKFQNMFGRLIDGLNLYYKR